MQATELVLNRAWLRFPGDYFRRPLGTYFANHSNRLLIYYQLGLLFLLAVIGGKAFVHTQTTMKVHLAFFCTYALHLSLTYTLGVYLANRLFKYFSPKWSSYPQRTVARQWLILSLGFLLGFFLHRLVAIHQVGIYAPWLSAYYGYAPQARPGHWQIFTFFAPVWAVSSFMVIQSALIWQKHQKKKLGWEARPALQQPQQTPAREQAGLLERPAEAQSLAPAISVNENGRLIDIPIAGISHVTVEDHYCRIFFQDQGRLRNSLLCAPLKSLSEQLPSDSFAQIHRSHLVNLGQVVRLTRRGRQYSLGLAQSGEELPISRYRWTDIRKRLPELPVDTTKTGKRP